MAEDGAVPESVKRNMRLLIDLRLQSEEADKRAKDVKARRDDQEVLLNDLLKGDSVTVDLGEGYGRRQFTPRKQTYSRILNEERLIAHYERLGLTQGVIEKKIRKAKLNEDIKNARDHGTELPPGIDFYDKKSVTITNRPRKG